MIILRPYQQIWATVQSSQTLMTDCLENPVHKNQPRMIQVMEKRTAFLINKSILPEDADKQL
jgi:hypothetical protein